MSVRQDAWTRNNDFLLAETVLRHVREGSTQLNAFEEVGDKLNRTSAACGFRWNAVVRRQYEQALELAKKQRKQKMRLLGKERSRSARNLYKPPIIVDDLQARATEFSSELETKLDQSQDGKELTLQSVIYYLQNLNKASYDTLHYKSESNRLKEENSNLIAENKRLKDKVASLENSSETMQDDYETLIQIMNRARKLVAFDEEDEADASSFVMDKNGNLEKVAK